MKVIIFGATGTIGKQLVTQALEAGHHVTAFTRKAENVTTAHPNLRIATGDAMSYDHVLKAIAGHEAVLCALGGGRKGIIRSEGTKNITRAMQATGIQKLICQTTLGCGESRGNLNFFWKNIMFGWFLKDAFLDHEQQEQYVLNSDLTWTIVRPAAFTDGDKTEGFQQNFGPDKQGLKLKIARADVAWFMLQQLTASTYTKRAVSISN